MLQVQYPVNFLRNLAAELAETDVIFHIGADFIPSDGLHDFLVSLAKKGLFAGRGAFAVPSFEVARGVTIPTNKEQLLSSIKRKEAKAILGQGEPTSVDGISEIAHVEFIDYPRWYKTENELYERPLVFENEPYVVVNRSQPCFPDYDERFIYYGGDKVEQVLHLKQRGWRFFVLPGHFVVHVQHAGVAWHGSERWLSRKKVWLLLDMVRQELKEKVTCPCPNHLMSIDAMNDIVSRAG